MDALIENTKKLQELRKLTDEEFSGVLGVDRSTWANIKSQRRKPGKKFLKALARLFPELTLDILAYLASGDHN